MHRHRAAESRRIEASTALTPYDAEALLVASAVAVASLLVAAVALVAVLVDVAMLVASVAVAR